MQPTRVTLVGDRSRRGRQRSFDSVAGYRFIEREANFRPPAEVAVIRVRITLAKDRTFLPELGTVVDHDLQDSLTHESLTPSRTRMKRVCSRQ